MRKYLIATLALALVAPVIALAEDKPQENIGLNYGKIEHTYTSQRDASTGLPTGRRMHKPYMVTSEKKKSGRVSVHDMTITKHVDKASPMLMQTNQPKTGHTTITPQGGLLSPTGSSFNGKNSGAGSAPPVRSYDLKGNKGG
jgi:type VI protein secretion system component Hcp